MAFPGGKVDPGDPSFLATALRETREELGIDLNASAEYLGPLPAQGANRKGSRLLIQPFVFSLTESPRLEPNHEVDRVIWVDLDSLGNGTRETTLHYEHEGRRLSFPAWEVEGHQVWGLTYRMVRSLLELLGSPKHG